MRTPGLTSSTKDQLNDKMEFLRNVINGKKQYE